MSHWGLVLGDVVSFLLTNRQTVAIPPAYGIVRIISSPSMDPCTLYCVPYHKQVRTLSRAPSRVLSEAVDYLGRDTELVSTKFVVPRGRWHPLGVVRTAYYDRAGTARDWWTGELLGGPKFHPFKRGYPPVELQRLVGGRVWRLVLPDGCVITSHGFEYP